MTSDRSAPREAFVWIWPPGATEPVVAGRLRAEGELFVFNYGRSWLARKDAVPIYAPELPLRAGAIPPEPPLVLANALRDASPDAWGRRVRYGPVPQLATGGVGDDTDRAAVSIL